MPANDSAIERCLECHLPKSSEGSYSLTQWISLCSCDLVDGKRGQVETLVFCANCNKRIVQARKGSFTQWVFRSDICNCENSQPKATYATSGSSINSEKMLFEADVEEEEELEVDEGLFPKARFKPIGILGQGASASVYLCRDRILNKKVAVKCLHYLHNDLLVAFQSEARINTRLEHPNIAKVIDFGVHEEATPYMVVEYVDGLSLEYQLLSHGIPDQLVAIKVLMQVCKALEYAHLQGVLHRDIKSGNIIFVEGKDSEISVSIIDFGLAIVREDLEDDSESGLVVGTPRYMSSDQARGLSYDKRSEIYSVGCVAFELLTGRTPFESDNNIELIRMHATKRAPLLSVAAPDLHFSEELEAIIARCLAKEPEARYQTLSELDRDLTNLSLVEAPLFEQELSPVKVEKRRSILPIVLTLILLVVALPSFYFLSRNIKASESDTKAVKTRDESNLVRPDSGNDSELELTGGKVTFSMKEGFMHPDNILGFEDKDMKYLQGKNYKTVSFYGTSVDGSGLKYLKDEPIVELSLDNCPIKDESLSLIKGSFPDLTALYMEYTAVSAKGLAFLDARPQFEEISLTGSKNIDNKAVPIIFARFPNLKRLSLSGTGIDDKALLEVRKFKKLERLYLDKTTIGDKGIEVLSRMPLAALRLSGTMITNRSLKRLQSMKSLKFLSLGECKLLSKEAIAELIEARPDLRVVLKERQKPLGIPF